MTSRSFPRIRLEIVTRLNQNRASTRYQAKFRTGWMSAEQYPDDAGPASAIRAVVDAGVPFKATAGLHHAVPASTRRPDWSSTASCGGSAYGAVDGAGV